MIYPSHYDPSYLNPPPAWSEVSSTQTTTPAEERARRTTKERKAYRQGYLAGAKQLSRLRARLAAVARSLRP